MTDAPMVVVIVAYGHATTLPATLAALDRQSRQPAEIVVVDNGDGSSANVARVALPRVQIICPDENLGFAGGCHAGVAASCSPLLAFVNPDVVLAPTWCETMAAALAAPDAGIIGGKLLYPDGRLQHAGGHLHWPLALTSHRGHAAPDRAEYDRPAAVDYITGAALGLRRDVWNTVGGMDPRFYPAYFEEVDLCIRVAAQGYPITYLPAATGVHFEASGLGHHSLPFYRLYHLNRLRLLWKHRPDEWLSREWLAAELAHLRRSADDREIDALQWAYRNWQAIFASGGDWWARIDGWDQPADEPTVEGELGWTLTQLRAKHTVRPLPFRSRWPLVAVIRTLWNRVATEAYLRPLVQQQNDYNDAVLDLAQALDRQRRAADAAVLAQGMLLAKLFSPIGRTSPRHSVQT